MQVAMFNSAAQQKAHGNYSYEEIRPLPVIKLPTRNNAHAALDCSFGVKCLSYTAGGPDPTGYNYEGYGNTVSIYQHLPHIDLSQALPGDIGIYGPGGAYHAIALYMWHDNHCWVWSMGHQGAPEIVTLGTMSSHFGPSCPLTWCQLVKPTPAHQTAGNPPRTSPKEKK